MFRLRIQEPKGIPREVQIKNDMVLGRADTATVQVNDSYVSGHQARVFSDEGGFYLEDLGSSNGTRVENGRTLAEGQREALRLGLIFWLGQTRVEVVMGEPEISPTRKMPPIVPAAASRPDGDSGLSLSLDDESGELTLVTSEAFAQVDSRQLLQFALDLPAKLTGASSETDVFQIGCASVVEALGGAVQSAFVLEAPSEEGHETVVLAQHGSGRAIELGAGPTISRRVLRKAASDPGSVVLLRRTSIGADIEATVPEGTNVVGGCLIEDSVGRGPLLFYVLGRQMFVGNEENVAAYLSVVTTLIRHQLRMLRNFSPAVQKLMMQQGRAGIDRLAEKPDRCEATSLFFDLRGFSLSTEAAASDLAALHSDLRNVLSLVTREVFKEGGTVVDYYGDGMFAAWGAPFPQETQCDQAVRCAQSIVQVLRDDTDLGVFKKQGGQGRWPCGIGIARGEILSGSVGSKEQFKYGLLGPSVNTAARLEGLTKPEKLGYPVLMTTEVQRELTDSRLATFRVGRVQAAGMKGVLEVHGLEIDADNPVAADGWPDILERLEKADETVDTSMFKQQVQKLDPDDPRHEWIDPLLDRLLDASDLRHWDGVIRFETK